MKNSFLETIKVFDGKVYNIAYHQKRYENVLFSFGIDSFEKLSSYIDAPSKGLFRCRVVYTLQNDITITYHPYTKRNIQSLKVVYDDTLQYAMKYENRESINSLYALRESCDDILIVKNNLITDTSIANIAFYDGKEWLTPKQPLLAGTTRERLIEEGVLKCEDIAVDDIKKFSSVALLNAMIDFDIIANIRYVY